MRPTPILPPPAAPKKKRKRRSWLLSLLGFGFASAVVLFLAAAGVAGFFFWKAARDLPDYESLAKYEPPVMTRIHAHDGSLMAEYARERRIFVPINVIPKLVIAAFLSAEDKRFYEHGGLDFAGIGRAMINNFQNWGKKRPEGASTITQQVAKNFLLSSEQKLDRKLKEAILAIRIERAYSKDKILELYLNEIYLGIGSYGVAAAALNYFSKELSELCHRRGRLSRRPAQGAQQLPSLPQDAGSHRAPQLDHRSDGGGRLHQRRAGEVGQGQALDRQYPSLRHPDLCGRLFRRRGAPPPDEMLARMASTAAPSAPPLPMAR
jgi:hypothetical protein